MALLRIPSEAARRAAQSRDLFGWSQHKNRSLHSASLREASVGMTIESSLCRHAITLLGSTQPKSPWERNDEAWCVGCCCGCVGGVGIARGGTDVERHGQG